MRNPFIKTILAILVAFSCLYNIQAFAGHNYDPELVNGRYNFHIANLSIDEPFKGKHIKLRSNVNNSNSEFIDFYIEDYYEMLAGRFSVQLYKGVNKNGIVNNKTFYKINSGFLRKYAVRDAHKTLPALKVVSFKNLSVNNHAAQQVIAIDNTSNPKGAFVVTAVYFREKNAVAMVSLIRPISSDSNKDFPWDIYNKFLQSLH